MERNHFDGRRRSLRLGLMAACAIAIAGACSSPAPARAQVLHGKFEIMTRQRIEERNTDTIRRLCDECIQGGRLERLPELVSADYRDGDQGPEALERRIDALRPAIPDLRFMVEELIAAGDRVVVRWTWSDAQEAVTGRGVAIYQLRDGKIVRDWLVSDGLASLP